MLRQPTKKQLEVLQLIADGLTSEDIALGLGNSKKTIESIRRDMLISFNSPNVANMVSIGYKHGFLKV